MKVKNINVIIEDLKKLSTEKSNLIEFIKNDLFVLCDNDLKSHWRYKEILFYLDTINGLF